MDLLSPFPNCRMMILYVLPVHLRSGQVSAIVKFMYMPTKCCACAQKCPGSAKFDVRHMDVTPLQKRPCCLGIYLIAIFSIIHGRCSIIYAPCPILFVFLFFFLKSPFWWLSFKFQQVFFVKKVSIVYVKKIGSLRYKRVLGYSQ